MEVQQKAKPTKQTQSMPDQAEYRKPAIFRHRTRSNGKNDMQSVRPFTMNQALVSLHAKFLSIHPMMETGARRCFREIQSAFDQL